MKDILNKLLSLFGNTLSMRLNSNHNSNKIKGDGNFVNQASRDINLFNLSVYREGDKNNLSRVEAEIGTILNELQRDINADDLNDAYLTIATIEHCFWLQCKYLQISMT